jgi:hypothetical protein
VPRFRFNLNKIKDLILYFLNFLIPRNSNLSFQNNFNYDSEFEILIVVPDSFYSDNWKPGCGNIFFELVESCKDNFHNSYVHILVVSRDKYFRKDIVVNFRKSKKSKLIFCFVEFGLSGDLEWDWAKFILEEQLIESYFIGILLDSIHPLIRFKMNLLQLKLDRSVFICIDQVIDPLQIKAKNVSGPCFLPFSNATISKFELWRNESQNITRFEDFNFTGKNYPYRQKFILSLRKKGIPISIGGEESLKDSNILSYEDYMKRFLNYDFNINLSANSRYRTKQLKSRVLECALMGKPIITDEVDLISKFYIRNQDFFYFSNSDDLILVSKQLNNFNLGGQNLFNKSVQIAKFSLFNEMLNLLNRP